MFFKDYIEQVTEDAVEYIEQNRDEFRGKDVYDAMDMLFVADPVTGNASGSYWFNSEKAAECCAEAVFDQEAVDALEEFGEDIGDLCKAGPETFDVVLRCAALGYAFDAVEKALLPDGKDDEDNE